MDATFRLGVVHRCCAKGCLLVFHDTCSSLGSILGLRGTSCLSVDLAEVLLRTSVFQIAQGHTHVLGDPCLCSLLVVEICELVSFAVVSDLGGSDSLASAVAHLFGMEGSHPRRVEHSIVLSHVLALIQIHVIVGVNGLVLETTR